MRVQSKAVAILLIASTSHVGAFTSYSGPSPSATVKASQSPLFTVVDSKSDTISAAEKDMEEKAWKIIKEKGEEDDSPKQIVSSSKVVAVALSNKVAGNKVTSLLDEMDLVTAIEEEAMFLVDEMADDTCEIDEMGNAVDEICADESKLALAKSKLKSIVRSTLGLVRTGGGDDLDQASSTDFQIIDFDDERVPEGELLERGWEERGNSSALRRNAEVWKFALSCVFKALKPKKLRKNGASEEEIEEAKTQAATFIRNGLLRLGPSFVKLVSMEIFAL